MMRVWSVRTREGNDVCVYDGKLALCRDVKQDGRVTPIVGFRLERQPQFFFLVSLIEDALFSITPTALCSNVAPLGIGFGSSPGTHSLHGILDYNWLAFLPLDNPAPMGSHRIDPNLTIARWSDSNLDWEELCLELYTEKLPSHVTAYHDYFAHKFRPDDVLQSVLEIAGLDHSTQVKKCIFNALYEFLSEDDLGLLARNLFFDNKVSRFFFETFSDDFWVKHSISPTIRWRGLRAASNPCTVSNVVNCDERFDDLQHLNRCDSFASIFHALSHYVRKSIRPTKKACIVTTVRNEGPFLLEWIVWHRLLGFEHIFIYTNDNDDGSIEMLQKLAEHNVITLIINEMGEAVRPQAKIYVHAFAVLADVLDYEWALVIDSDEFLALNRDEFTGVNDFLQWMRKRQTDAIAINWVYMCSDDSFDFRKDLVTDRRYWIKSDIIGDANHVIKSFVRPRQVMSVTEHFPVWSKRSNFAYRLPHGAQHRYAHNRGGYSDNPLWADTIHREMIYIHHYHYKSTEEFLLRLYRGDALDTEFKKGMCKDLFKETSLETFNTQHRQFGDLASDRFFLDRDMLLVGINDLVLRCDLSDCLEAIYQQVEERLIEMRHLLLNNLDELGPQANRFAKIFAQLTHHRASEKEVP